MNHDWDLEDWLLEASERAERKVIAGAPLSPIERLTREFWIFDIHSCNGGVSQYFCNHGAAQWQEFKSAWIPDSVPSLGPILLEVDGVIAGASDPFVAALNASATLDYFYHEHRLDAWREVQQLAPAA